MATIEYKGHEIEYDAALFHDYRWQKSLMRDPFGAMERLFMGRDEEVAELFGGDIDEMGEVIRLITAKMGGKAKN